MQNATLTPSDRHWRVRIGPETTSAAYDPPGTTAFLGLAILAHGAGGHLGDRGMLEIAGLLRECGLGVVRFNFLYREQRRRFPDPMPRLLDAMGAVVGKALSEIGPSRLFLGGRSMGGRAASMLAAEGYPSDGLILMGYPLHAPGRHDRLRDGHLPRIAAPVLCFNGTRDAFCRQDLMESVLPGLGPGWTMHWLEGANHSFRVTRASGRTAADVRAEIAQALTAWLGRLPARTSAG